MDDMIDTQDLDDTGPFDVDEEIEEPGSEVPDEPARPSASRTRRPSRRTTGGDADTVAVLEEIRDHLRRRQRDDRHEDFSVARLLGTLTQMLALVAGIWGLMSVVASKGDALVRLSLAIFLQLVALTAFVAGGRKA